MSYEEGALIEPLSVGIHSCQRGEVGLGTSVLIMGAGPIGLVCILVAKAMGAGKIIAVDINKERLDLAVEMGATGYVNTFIGEEPLELTKRIHKKFDGDTGDQDLHPQVTMECSGVESAIQTSVYATRTGGKVLSIGRGKPIINFPINNASAREVDILGVFRYNNTWPKAISMISSGQIDVSKLVSHRVTLANALEAFELTRTGQGVKVMINCAEE